MSFTIRLETEVSLTVEELWPDKDAPDNPTVEDVRSLIEQCGGADRVLDEWALGPLHIWVGEEPE